MNMTGAVKGFASNPAFMEMLAGLADVPVLGILAGLVITVIVQSSSATVAMLQSLAVTGALNFSGVYPIVMGINIGTTLVTAFYIFLGGEGRDSKRTGVVHIVFNVIGTVVFMVLLSVLQSMNVFGAEFWSMTVDSNIIALFQTAFNVFTAVLLIPFTNLLVKMSVALIKDVPTKTHRHPELHTLNEHLYISPALAVVEANKAVAAMGHLAKENLKTCCEVFLGNMEADVETIEANEDSLDRFADRSDRFLIGLSKAVETDRDDRQVDMLLQTVPSFERVGDYGMNILELSQRLKEENATFSESAMKELRLLCDAIDEILDITVDAFEHDSNEKAKAIEPLEETIDDMVMILKDRHTKRLKAGTCSIGTGLIFMESLTHLERVADHCSSIGVMMLARMDEKILHNHHKYLQEIHSGSDLGYAAACARRREQYLKPLMDIQ